MGRNLRLPGRAVVFRENEIADGVFFIYEGQLKLSATSPDGRVMILQLAVAGDILGLSPALNEVQYEVTAETLEPSTIKRVDRVAFLNFVRTYREVGKKISQVLAQQYREVSLNTRRLALARSASGRLAGLLLDWTASQANGKPSCRLTMALTHEELANMAGTARETVTRLLNQFERDGLIVRHGASIILLRPDKLDLLAG
jgi:CRP/FNR family transcriptional regulator